MHGDISLIQLVIPGLTRNPAFFWILAFAGMASIAVTNVVVYFEHFDNCYLSLF